MSGHFALNIEFVSVPHGTDDEFEAFLDHVLEQLEGIDCDVSMSASLANRTASFAIHVEGDVDDVETRFLIDLRTALHAANCGTAGWPTFVPRRQSVEEFQPA